MNFDQLQILVSDTLRKKKIVPPVRLETLQAIAGQIIRESGLPHTDRDIITVLTGNAIWEETVAATPFHRRVLLLPQCLRHPELCEADMDAFGLLCADCGRCVISPIQEKADSLGYTVLVAEGTTVVTRLIQQGGADAVIGVGCLASLERSFPYTLASAVPSLAVPLLRDGCRNTDVDCNWLFQILERKSTSLQPSDFGFKSIQNEMQSWFDASSFQDLVHWGNSSTEQIALQWMTGEGKRWRPFLTAAVYGAMHSGDPRFNDNIKRLAIAVECFHKASLIHDDLEDEDPLRYNHPTLHKQYNSAIAINAGDFLVGEGYRIITETQLSPDLKSELLRIAAFGHRRLCIGQGEELNHARTGQQTDTQTLICQYALKTSPAFGVALKLGAVAAGGDSAMMQILEAYSHHLGIAYQIRDDIEDWKFGDNSPASASMIRTLQESGDHTSVFEAVQQSWRFVEAHRDTALDALDALDNALLKRLLYKVAFHVAGLSLDQKTTIHHSDTDEEMKRDDLQPAARKIP